MRPRATRSLISSFMIALTVLVTVSVSAALADDAPAGDASHPGARLFPAGRIRLGTGRQVPASVFGSPLLVREEPDGSALALVGYPGEDDQRGAVYVFERAPAADWRWIQTLLPDDFATDHPYPPGEDTREFGASLALDGDRLVVGAPFHHRQHGAVYVLERDPAGRWLPAGQLVPTHHWDRIRGFGESVALDGDTALVGSYHDDGGQGAAYVYARGDDGAWRQTQRIASHHYAPIDVTGYPSLIRFGVSVALDGDVAVIGAELANFERGAATLYARGSDGQFEKTTELQPLQSTDGYGRAVAVEGGTVIIGAWQDSSSGGAVYAFHQREDGVWLLAQRIAPSPPLARRFDEFGLAIALDGDVLAVGAPNYGGRVHVFYRDGDQWLAALALEERSERDVRPIFGRAVALHGETLVVGDIGDTRRCPTDDECHTGAAHAYRLDRDGTPTLIVTDHQKLMFTSSSYGHAVVADDDLVIVGDPRADDACPEDPDCNSGAVHIQGPGRGGIWVESQRIAPADLEFGAWFGDAVAQDGEWLAVSAPGYWAECAEGEPCASRAVYLYRRAPGGAWVEARRIPSPRAAAGFGTDLALRGDLLAVGRTARLGDVVPGDSVHVFRLDPATSEWRAEGALSVDRSGSWNEGGLAIDGAQVLTVDSRLEDDGRWNNGFAVLERESDGWTESQFIDPPNAVPDFAADGGILVVRQAGTNRNGALVYERDEDGMWSPAGALPPPDAPSYGFGTSLSVSGDWILVGDPGYVDTTAPELAFLYRRDPDGAWHLAQTLAPLEPDETNGFGWASSLRGRTAVVGAPAGQMPNSTKGPGRISIYRLQDPRLYLPALNTVRRRF